MERRGYQAGPDLITALGIVGTGVYLPMLAAQTSFTLGRAETCCLRVDQQYLAPMHARIERIVGSPGGIHVMNVSSGKNDIVFNGEIAKSRFMMDAADWFEIGESKYFALSEEMRLARPPIVEILGIRQYSLIDDLLIAAAKHSSHHILLIGEQGCDQVRLGSLIHYMSHRRRGLFHAVPEPSRLDSAMRQVIRDTGNGTLLIPLYKKGRLDERFVAMVTDPAMKRRLVICAPSRKKIDASFPVTVTNRATEITIPPLRARKAEISELLDQWFIEDASPLRFRALRPAVRERLLAYDWPRNLQELRETADYLEELVQYRSARQATTSSSITRSTLRGWLRRLDLSLEFPLVPDKTHALLPG
jgi:hypothetical protein